MITENIFAWATRTPDKVAVIHDGRPWSYRSFAGHILVARNYFVRQGVAGPGYAVVAAHDLMDSWVFSLALRSLGLDTVAVPNAASTDTIGLPDLRYLVMTEKEAATWPLRHEFCAARGLKLLSVFLEDEPGLDLELPSMSLPVGGNILRTSGTTGIYKNVLMSAAIDRLWLRRNAGLMDINQDTVFGAFNFPVWTAAGYRLTATPWIVGGTSVIQQESELLPTLLTPGLSHAFLVPVMLAQLLAMPRDSFARNDSLQLIVSSGPMTRTQIREAKARITPRLINLLSSTEAGVIGLTPLATDDDPRSHRLAPDRVIEIVDEAGNKLPVGETGQMRIGTSGGPTGYVHDAAATKAFFRDGFFYPGDLAVIGPDGRLSLQGRYTSVINWGGYKISAELLEDRLANIPGVSGSCLISIEDDDGEERLHLAIECATPIETDKILAEISKVFRRFPSTHVYYFRALGRTATGKIMRQAVRDQVIALLAARTSEDRTGVN